MVQRKLSVNNACRLLIIWKSRQLFCSERWFREQRCFCIFASNRHFPVAQSCILHSPGYNNYSRAVL